MERIKREKRAENELCDKQAGGLAGRQTGKGGRRGRTRKAVKRLIRKEGEGKRGGNEGKE